MNKKQYKFLWVTTQVLLFVLPIMIAIALTPYDINYDEEYIFKVNVRAFEGQDGKITDFKDAVVANKDAQGDYVKKEWKLKNQEIYYLINILSGVFIGATLQLGNLSWMMGYDNY